MTNLIPVAAIIAVILIFRHAIALDGCYRRTWYGYHTYEAFATTIPRG